MFANSWIQILISVISIVAAIVSASLTYYFSKRNQLFSDESRLKEKFYLEYIDALSENVSTGNHEKSKRELSVASNNLLLVGSADVVIKLRKFSFYISPDNISEFNSERHNELLTELIKSMRLDLYKNKKINKGYPIVGVLGKNRINEK